MSGLSPMLLMVCEQCRDNRHAEWCNNTGCTFEEHRHGRGPAPARTRDEMVDPAWEAMRNGATCAAALAALGICPDRGEVEVVLVAAGVIQSEEGRDASV